MKDLQPNDISWCVRRLPKKLRQLLEAEPVLFVAGGFIRSCISQEKVNDIDIFAPSPLQAESAARWVCGPGQWPYKTQNAYTVVHEDTPVQFICRWVFGNPAECLASFDFAIARCAIFFDSVLQKWCGCCDDNFYADLAAKRLVYLFPERNEDAGGSLLRVLKFYQRGYRIPLDSLAGVIARLMHGISTTGMDEKQTAGGILKLLREVDPAVDPTDAAHLPAEGQFP